MLAFTLLTLATLLQPSMADRSRPVVAELCNDTPATVAFAVARPSAGAGQVQRGWFSVEPGQCLEGGIGNGRGGLAYVHAFSGGYSWPVSAPNTSFCTPARNHERAVGSASCSDDERALRYAPVQMDSHGTHHSVSYRVGCQTLAAEDATLCALGLRDQTGFAERVRQLEVCNMSGRDDRVAIAAPNPAGENWQISDWVDLPNTACEIVWRGLVPDRSVYVTSELGSPVGDRGDYARSFCVAATAQTVAGEPSDTCVPQSGQLREFGQAQFSPRSSRFTVMMNP